MWPGCHQSAHLVTVFFPLSNILFVNEKNSLSVSRVIFADVNLFCLITLTQNFDEGKGCEQIWDDLNLTCLMYSNTRRKEVIFFADVTDTASRHLLERRRHFSLSKDKSGLSGFQPHFNAFLNKALANEFILLRAKFIRLEWPCFLFYFVLFFILFFEKIQHSSPKCDLFTTSVRVIYLSLFFSVCCGFVFSFHLMWLTWFPVELTWATSHVRGDLGLVRVGRKPIRERDDMDEIST